MTAVEITLLIAGIICVVVSIIFDKGSSEEKNEISVSAELSEADKKKIKEQINEIIDSEMEGIGEKTEAQLDKISNTKLLEMNEYAETILGEINRNHNETVFLYDMLNEKSKEIKSTVKDVNQTKKQVEKMSANVAVKETVTGAKTEPDQTANAEAAYKTPNTASSNSKDAAKERLMALVRKSNDRARAEDGSIKRSDQAEALKNNVESKANSDNIPSATDKAADDGAATDKAVKEKTATDKAVNEKTATDKAADEKAATDKAADEKAATDKAVDEKVATDKAADEGVTADEFTALVSSVPVAENKTTGRRKTGTAKNKSTAATESTARTKRTAKNSKAEKAENSGDNVKTDKIKKPTAVKEINDESRKNIQIDETLSKNEKVLKFHDLGMANKDIAKQLNMGIGEVKLVIDLYKGGR